jgi:hypothetical protein
MTGVPINSPWTPALLKRLDELWAGKLSAREIGLDLGVSRNAVIDQAHRRALPRRQSPDVPPYIRCRHPFINQLGHLVHCRKKATHGLHCSEHASSGKRALR